MKTLSLHMYRWFIGRILWLKAAVKTKAFWADVIVLLCGALFLYSAVDKLRNYETFRVQVGKSPILTGYEDFIAWSIPAIELLIALIMVPLWLRHIGLYAFFTLMLLFTGYIILLLRDGSVIPCGCNALTEDLSLEAHIVMNLVFCALAMIGVFISAKPNLHFDREHPLYRDCYVPVKSRIRSISKRFNGKEASGTGER